MCSKMALYLASVIPFPREVVCVPYDYLTGFLPGEVIDNRESFAMFYNHFMNYHHIASQMKVVSVTRGETSSDVWLRCECMLQVKKIYDKTIDDGLYCDACRVYDVELCNVPPEDLNDIAVYEKQAVRYAPLDEPLSRPFTLLDVMRIIRLTDVEKFYAMSLPTLQDMYAYTINTMRIRMAFHRQEGSIDLPFFLN